ncbi:MAG: hypothetical protein COA45_12145 [Zetaproteobacteria bacterium]|nr:MAG: hypothetical protein COA45_12145 [Zetaproteobacteria bacterium]
MQSGDYHNESEYIRDLVRKDREKLSDDQKLLNLLRQSEQSGVNSSTLPDQAICDKYILTAQFWTIAIAGFTYHAIY